MDTDPDHEVGHESSFVKSKRFRAFSQADWKRIESIAPQTRRVGQMMQKEAMELVGTARMERAKRVFDVGKYAMLCTDAGILCTIAQSAVPKPSVPNKKKKTLNVREQVSARAAEHERGLVRAPLAHFPKGLQENAEVFLVCARRWLHQKTTDQMDALVSCTNLQVYLESEDYPTEAQEDLAKDRHKLLSGHNFLAMLQMVADAEASLASPSFSDITAGLKLYPEQEEVAELTLQMLRARLQSLSENDFDAMSQRALFLRFCTPPSTGKSSAAAYIGALFQGFSKEADKVSRERKEKFPRGYVMYVCYNESVRFDVAKTCAGANVPFAIVTNCVACPSYSCFFGKGRKAAVLPACEAEWVSYSLSVIESCDIIPIVLVMDTESAFKFLHSRQDLHSRCVGDVLLFDEPTTSHDKKTNEVHGKILQLLPPVSVLLSATLPQLKKMPKVCETYLRRFPGASFRSIESKRIASPCTLLDGEGRVIAPHNFFQGPPENLAKVLQEQLHIYRLYSPRAALKLFLDMPDVETSAREWISKRCPSLACSFASIRQCCLEAIARCDAPLPWQPREAAHYACPCIPNMCTDLASRYPGTSIVISEDEDVFWMGALPPLFGENYERVGKRLALCRTLEDKKSSIRVHVSHNRDKAKEKTSKVERAQQESTRRDASEVPALWPPEMCVNTVEHAKRYHSGEQFWQWKSVPLLPDDVLEKSNQDLVEGLLAGVCTLHSKYGDQSFALASLDMAESRHFTYLSGGRASIYGVNLPCDRVIILLDPRHTTTEMLVQSMGRCGRTGKYSRSEVVFGSYALLLQVLDVGNDTGGAFMDALLKA